MGSATVQPTTANVICKKCHKSLKGIGGIRIGAGQSAGSACRHCVTELIDTLDNMQTIDVGDIVTIKIKETEQLFDVEVHRATKTMAMALVEDEGLLDLLKTNNNDELSFPKEMDLSDTSVNSFWSYFPGRSCHYHYSIAKVVKEDEE